MRRKFLCVILCVSLLLLLIPGFTASAGNNNIVRVELSLENPAAIPFYVDGNYSVAGIPLERQLYTIKLEGGVLNLYSRVGVVASGPALTLEQHSPTDGRNNFIWMNLNNHGYLGNIEFIPAGGGIQVINDVYIEDYLYGVVPHEMSDSWPVEALKAQAVAARGYAEKNISGILKDTSADQVYDGFNPAYGNSIQAVNETAKNVLMYNGEIIGTYYSASNGGYTDIPQHVWTVTEPLPYQVIQADPYDVQNPSSKQEVLIFPKAVTDTNRISYLQSGSGTMVPGDGSEAPKAEEYLKASALAAVAAKGYVANGTGDFQIVGINSIVPNTYDTTRSQKHGGVPGVYDGHDATGANGCVDFTNANINMTVLAKRYVTSTGAPIVMLGDCNGDGKISISDYTFMRLDILGLKPLADNARIAADVNQDGKISISDYTLARLDILGLKAIAQPDPSLGVLVQEPVAVDFTIDMHAFDTGGPYAAFHSGDSTLRLFIIEQTDTSWNIYHRRYGHGIGLSQRGAQQRANLGIGYADILSFYFPNTTLTPLAYDRPALTPISPPDSTNTTVIDTDGPLNVRSGPGTSNPVVGTLPYGARITVIDNTSNPDWFAIDYGGTNPGYVSASKVKHD